MRSANHHSRCSIWLPCVGLLGFKVGAKMHADLRFSLTNHLELGVEVAE